MAIAIATEQLIKTYKSGLFFGHQVRALKGINLSIAEGGVFGLLGPNGAGKTTLVKILLGIVRPTSGVANILGQPHYRQSMRQQIGYLPEHFQVARHHTGVSALYFLGRLSRMTDSAIRKRIPEVIELVGLRGREKELVRTYSKGMKQRLGLAQALLHNPKLIFLDEPTDGLDPLGRHHVRLCIEALKSEGKTVFLNSHILQEVEMICDQFAIMSKGTVKASGTLQQLLSCGTVGGDKTVLMVQGTPEIVKNIVSSLASVLKLQCEQETDGAQIPNLSTKSVDENNSTESGLATTLADGSITENSISKVFRLTLESILQSDIDYLVDSLRKKQISVMHLSIHRPRLEQVFMQLVQNDDALVTL